MEFLASVIIPVYNQFDSLQKVLKGFMAQSIPPASYEIIVVDDGSTDGLASADECGFNLPNLRLIRQKNSGRAAARNTGIAAAGSDTIVFCDGDRVPAPDFLEEHIRSHNEPGYAVVGKPMDYFGKAAGFEGDICWDKVARFSRVPNYFARISKIYINGYTQSRLAWLSFLVGNSSVDKSLLTAAGGFEPVFIEWGFEHFELAYRMQQAGCRFKLNINAINYHLPHPRRKNFYSDMIAKNALIMKTLHPQINIRAMTEIITREVDVSAYNDSILQSKGDEKC
ncbi:MAG TPA: glycosyltransferase [Clostridia bacterium]|nr:glycosyltransferase [Clostridia bacterium]